MTEHELEKVKGLSDELLLACFYDLNNSFKKLVNDETDDGNIMADKIYAISFVVENELLNRENIDLKDIYKV